MRRPPGKNAQVKGRLLLGPQYKQKHGIGVGYAILSCIYRMYVDLTPTQPRATTYREEASRTPGGKRWQPSATTDGCASLPKGSTAACVCACVHALGRRLSNWLWAAPVKTLAAPVNVLRYQRKNIRIVLEFACGHRRIMKL